MTRDIASARADFPALQRTVDGRQLILADGPAGTQVPRQVIDAIASYYSTSNANTHGHFVTSRETDSMLHDARAALADLLGAAGPETISFGANMTTLAFALSHALGREIREGDEVVVTELDHEANRAPWMRLREHGAVIREVPITSSGTLDMAAFERLISSRTRIIAAGFASNALGTVNDLAAIRTLARRAGAKLIVDAVHGAPHFPIDVQALDADFLFCSAYKFYSPHVGVLYSRPGLLDALATDRLITAGQQAPERIETGTLNHAAIAGVLAGVEYLESFGSGGDRRSRLVDALTRIASHERSLARHYWDGLNEIPGVRTWGPGFDGDRAPTVSFTLDGTDADDVARRLAERGVAVWSGHFYALRAVESLGLLDRGGLVRAGFFLYSSEEDVTRLLDAIRNVAEESSR